MTTIKSIARASVLALTLSTAGFVAWKSDEGFTDRAVIPTKNDVPTIGHGSTQWENGTPVKLGDTITPQRADVLARTLNSRAEQMFAASLPGVTLHQAEYDAYISFVGQFGIGNWRRSGMRKALLAGQYTQACHALLRYRYAGGYDCSTPGNKVCQGVWTRQQRRHAQCMAAQT